MCHFWLSEGQLGLDPQVGEGVNPAGFVVSATTWAKLAFLEGNLDTYRKVVSSNSDKRLQRMGIRIGHLKVQIEVKTEGSSGFLSLKLNAMKNLLIIEEKLGLVSPLLHFT